MNKSPLPSPKSSRPSQDPDSKAEPSQPSPTTRPPLQRSSYRKTTSKDSSGQSAPSPKRHETSVAGRSGKMAKEGQMETSGEGDVEQGTKEKASPDEAELERLRQLQLKMLQKQQRARMGPSNPGMSPRSLGARRVSPIKEENSSTISPTLEASFSSPMASAHTTSTESTESGKTIRGSVPPTPANQPMRTPSYPFPVVPGTPRAWPSAFHQPFTNLSPTVSAMHMRDSVTPRERLVSGDSTPAASTATFLPSRGEAHPSPTIEDPRYPSPSLYDLVLLLGSEPGLTAWWNIVITVMREWYGAERATIAVPADTSDIENVPWAQKSTFNYAGMIEAGPAREPQETGKGSSMAKLRGSEAANTKIQMPERQEVTFSHLTPMERPKLAARHSFAGHERQKKDLPTESSDTAVPTRPRGPLRTASHAPQSMPRRDHPLRQVSQVSPLSFDGTSFQHGTPLQGPSFSDPEFSSIGGDWGIGPHSAVFSVLKPLDHESDPLIDNSGVNRVLERGKLVTLTRDYAPSIESSRKNSTDEDEDQTGKPAGKHATLPSQELLKSSGLKFRSGNASNRLSKDYPESKLQPHYEEYEQFPSSPWAQSPAPSPAIQADQNENPFFSSSNVDEETFNPSSSAQDYSQFGLVEAIGVDKASTVIHIPLIHPTLSQSMQPPKSTEPSETPSLSRSFSEQSIGRGSVRSEFERKAPIAILSILSPTVPYPQNLTKSLKLLGPHLATTFSNAWQYTNVQNEATSFNPRRQNGFAPMSDQQSLDHLMHLDLENMRSSTAGSMTSPSDYSGRSRPSPGGSLGGTPGWDPSYMGFSSRHSVSGTPGHLSGTETVEGYFDAKKRSNLASSSPTTQMQQEHGGRRVEKRASKRSPTAGEGEEDEVITPRNEQKATSDMTGQADTASQTVSSTPQPVSPRRPTLPSSQSSQSVVDRRPHSLLHSYGADFSSSFQSLPTATTPGLRTPAPSHGHGRSGSITEAPEMPPPSENLLRTIIDSLPVQIFTTLPTTGALTWVNSKYLVYRGQESREVLQDPWEAIHEDDRDKYLQQWNLSLRTGQQLQQKVRLKRFDKSYRWFYVRVAPLRNKRQQIVHWIGTNMDFHEQHQAELDLIHQKETAASEAKYRALANSSPQVVFVISNKRGLTFCNSQWTLYSGQEESQARGAGFLEHVHPEDVPKCRLPEMSEDGSIPLNVPTSLPPDRDRHGSSSSSEDSSETEKGVMSPGRSSPVTMEMPQARLSKLASQGILKVTKDADGRSSYSTEVRLRSKEGEYRWYLVRILLENSLSEDNDEETWYGTATDINDHKLLEQTLKETMDAKTRFLSNMSHEIRTPLNGISGMVNFLLDSILNAEQLEQINIIKASTDSLLNLINDILDLSKVEAGMIKLSMDWLHIPSLLEEVNDLNMGLAIQKGLELNYLVEEEVPSMVKGDKFRLRQVLLNVVGNAIKFTQRGEIFVRCRLATPDRTLPPNADGAMIRFEVIDTGSGFSEEEAKYLFKRFSQIDASSTRQHGGTGLGLAISMQFVELHGGKMDARSTPGKGSTFFFTIRFGLPTEDDHPPQESMTPSFQGAATPVIEATASNPPLSVHHILTQKLISSPLSQLTRKDRHSSESSDQSNPIKSPAPSLPSSEKSRESPALSSGSSDPSIYTGRTSIRSERSSASSFDPDPSLSRNSPMSLALPTKRHDNDSTNESDESLNTNNSADTLRNAPIQRSLSPLGSALQPPMYSILVVCPLVYSREATVRHIKMVLPKSIPHQITAQANLMEAQKMIGGDDPVLFTHVVLVLHDSSDVIAIMDQIFASTPHSSTSIVIISDPTQKKEIMQKAPSYNYDKLVVERRLRFIYRPLKPSKFAIIFDPQKERESSTDRNKDSAQQVAVSQKLVFEDLKRRLGGKGHKVLLVEDNHINQTVILKFLAKIAVETETVLDGVQCTDKVFSKPHGYYSIILCDLHMPNKDGYQACKEIRRWERKNKIRHLPIIALSANVLGDVYAKCVEAGFNSYVTKPVEFKELSLVMTKFLDPEDPSKPHEFMRVRK